MLKYIEFITSSVFIADTFSSNKTIEMMILALLLLLYYLWSTGARILFSLRSILWKALHMNVYVSVLLSVCHNGFMTFRLEVSSGTKWRSSENIEQWLQLYDIVCDSYGIYHQCRWSGSCEGRQRALNKKGIKT